MAFSNFTELQADIAEWLNRGDLTARVPSFILLAEAKIARRLRRRTVVADVTLASGTETVALPGTAAELRSVRLKTATSAYNAPLDVVTKQIFDAARPLYAVTGRPMLATVLGTTLYVLPAPDQNYTAEVTYFDGFTPLSGSNATNWVLSQAPDLYLYAALAAAEPYLKNDERLPLWQALAKDALDELETAREREEVGPSPQPMGLPVVFG